MNAFSNHFATLFTYSQSFNEMFVFSRPLVGPNRSCCRQESPKISLNNANGKASFYLQAYRFSLMVCTWLITEEVMPWFISFSEESIRKFTDECIC